MLTNTRETTDAELREAIEAFQEACENYGWSSDQGSPSHAISDKIQRDVARSHLDVVIQAREAALRADLDDVLGDRDETLIALELVQTQLAEARARIEKLSGAGRVVLRWADDMKPYAEDGSKLVPCFEALRAALEAKP